MSAEKTGAFTADDSKKTKDDLIYERNTHRKQAKELKQACTSWTDNYEDAVDTAYKTLMDILHETTDKEPVKKALWKHFAKYPREPCVFTEKTTGEKTHKGRRMVRRKGGVMAEIDCHLLPDGSYYKPWGDNDEPAFFMKPTRLCPENFTINDNGAWIPIKKY